MCGTKINRNARLSWIFFLQSVFSSWRSKNFAYQWFIKKTIYQFSSQTLLDKFIGYSMYFHVAVSNFSLTISILLFKSWIAQYGTYYQASNITFKYLYWNLLLCCSCCWYSEWWWICIWAVYSLLFFPLPGDIFQHCFHLLWIFFFRRASTNILHHPIVELFRYLIGREGMLFPWCMQHEQIVCHCCSKLIWYTSLQLACKNFIFGHHFIDTTFRVIINVAKIKILCSTLIM